MSYEKTPAQRAFEISSEAAKIGFDWPQPLDVIPKLHEEIQEIELALRKNDNNNLIEEIGDLFFALVNLNRKANIDSDAAFHRGVDKFERRYRRLVQIIEMDGRDIHSLSPDELENVWMTVKKEENHGR